MSKPTHGKGDNRRDNLKSFRESSYWDKEEKPVMITLGEVREVIKHVEARNTKSKPITK
tara:strand:+ start:1366 stop:1542 length:177 start_codon:yes stop_codon:yes gene_type:complete